MLSFSDWPPLTFSLQRLRWLQSFCREISYSLRQIHTSKLSPRIRTALDNISSIATQMPAHCRQCGTLMTLIDADLWLEGSDQRWSIKLPVCVECNSEDINAILSKVS
jgi:hypothetical protein